MKIGFKFHCISILIDRISQFWKGYNIFERVFWTIILTISCNGMAIFIYYTFKTHFSEPVSITVDTDYVHWNFSFPAVSICLVKGKNNMPIEPILRKFNYSNIKRLVRNIHICMFAIPNQMDTFFACDELRYNHGIDFEALNELVLPKSCDEFMESVLYDQKEYNCVDIFKFHKTEVGHCFTANSITDYGYSFDNLKLKYQISSRDKTLSMRLKTFKVWLYSLYVHSPEDLPVYSSDHHSIYSTQVLYSYNVDKIITDTEAGKESISRRGCRFPDEKLDGLPFHYRFLQIQAELQVCNCTHSTSPDIYRSQYCDLSGLMCLLNGNINAIVRELAMDDNICMPSCTEQILKYAGPSELSSQTNASYTDLSIEVANFPFARYRRSLNVTKLDLAVAIAGLAGLFFGVSVLNVVEVIYYLVTGK